MQVIENDPAVDKALHDFAASLSEKDRRRFAAVEAKQRGHGGIRYICGGIGCSEKTIERGMKELEQLPEDPVAGRIRRPGAGRKKRSNRNRPRKKLEFVVWK